MKEADRQRVYDTDDEGLRHYTHDHLKVFAKFTSQGCATCELLAPPFAKFADDEQYQPILFLRLDSDENPVAKKLMQERVAPFFVSYCQGQLLECDSLTTEEAVRGMLDRLRAFVPHTR
ncbi:thioredoxin family protein [Hymenobacter jeollabukensis]|uniref:Thioredoxin family protein n=1 Tax=Hymenobacter jeollabukensis TaxID=2025313 RepID=A0A5R8WWA1_9BACT|nr:thioredoxin family protein [Hymenobacter jeollabukensis]TLM96736.1 thioredoxin family protein [Hymenobacter jeollabukensis]